MIGAGEQLDASLLRIGQEFAGHRVEAGLGRQSGVGRVYEATHLGSGRRVALKVFTGATFRNHDLRTRFDQTTQIQARLRHPSVVRLQDWGKEPAPYLVMSLIRGPTLADMLQNGEVDDRRTLEILRAVAVGLDAGARQGLLYRRLQPRGVLIDQESGEAFLGDFGASRPGRSTELIETGRLGAYADYIPPEEANGHEADAAGSVYSLGAIAFEALTGRPPFAASQPWATLRGHLEEPPPGPGAVRDDLPDEVDDVIMRALAKDPADRQDSAAGLMQDLDRAFPTAQRTGGAVVTKPSRRRSRRIAASVAVVAWVAAAVVLGALVSEATESDPAAPSVPETARNADLVLRYPSDWERTRPAPRIEGLTLAGAVSVAPRERDLDDGELVAGRIESGRLPPQPAAPVVDLRGILGRRYQGLSEPGSSRKVVAYAIPAAGGQVLAACLGPSAGTFASRCQRVASTLRARQEGPALAVPSPTYARSLAGVVTRLDRVRGAGRRRLARARTPAGQRRITTRLARDYRRLAGDLARIDAPAQARASHRRAVAQLRRSARAFGGMARAARSQRGGQWMSARNGVRRAEGGFQSALRQLRPLGYDVR